MCQREFFVFGAIKCLKKGTCQTPFFFRQLDAPSRCFDETCPGSAKHEKKFSYNCHLCDQGIHGYTSKAILYDCGKLEGVAYVDLQCRMCDRTTSMTTYEGNFEVPDYKLDAAKIPYIRKLVAEWADWQGLHAPMLESRRK